MHASISAIEYYLPESILSTQMLDTLFPEWDVAKIAKRTGIEERRIAAVNECASDLAVSAALRLFSVTGRRPDEIDFILFCTQSPDFLLPTTACLLQQRLGIPTGAGALDYNLGCSGFVYGLGLSEGLISSSQAKCILLITADTYSKYIDSTDRNCRILFGDASAAVLIEATDTDIPLFGPFVYGTDGNGAKDLIVPNSASRLSLDRIVTSLNSDKPTSTSPRLHMSGHKIFDFALRAVPENVSALLKKARLEVSQIDLFIFHQANTYILEQIRCSLNIPQHKMQIYMSHCGNTVSSSIPIALKHALLEGRLHRDDKLVLAGFGVGYSWASMLLRWA